MAAWPQRRWRSWVLEVILPVCFLVLWIQQTRPRQIRCYVDGVIGIEDSRERGTRGFLPHIINESLTRYGSPLSDSEPRQAVSMQITE